MSMSYRLKLVVVVEINIFDVRIGYSFGEADPGTGGHLQGGGSGLRF